MTPVGARSVFYSPSGQKSGPARGAFAHTKLGGSGAVSSRTALLLALVLTTVCAFGFAAGPALALDREALSTTLGTASTSPADPYPLSNPTAIAVDNSSGPSSGDIYVIDSGNNRVEKFNSSGEFLATWGAGVVASGPDKLPVNERQTVTLGVFVTGGTFTLGFEGQTTTAIRAAANAAEVQSALQALSTIGASDVGVTGSTGGPWTVEFIGTLANKPVPDLTLDLTGLTGTPSAEVVTITKGNSAAEVCTPAAGDTCQAGTEASAPGTFRSPMSSIAVDSGPGPSSGDVYVSDLADLGQENPEFPGSVSKFDPSGHLISSWGEGGALSFPGRYPYGNEHVLDMAVDSTGNVFVLGGGNNPAYREYDESGASVFAREQHSERPRSFTVDIEDNSYFNTNFSGLLKYNSAGESLGSVEPSGGVTGLATDPTTTDVYAIQGGAFVNRYAQSCSQSCTPLESFGEGALNGAQGLGASATGKIYVANSGENDIAVFAPVPYLPTVLVSEVSNQSPTSVTLDGEVDPAGAGAVTACHFEYGTNSDYTLGSVPCSPDPAVSPPGSNFTNPTDVGATLTGLIPETTYHYRLVAEDAHGEGSATGAVTPHVVVGLRTDPATQVTPTGAVLSGSLIGDGKDTHYYFEWGPTSSYGHATAAPPGSDLGSPSGPARTSVPSVTLDGLDLTRSPYHYRVVATNEYGTSYGNDETIAPSHTAPLVREYVSNVQSEGVALDAQISSAAEPTLYHFEYVTDTAFQKSGYAEAIKVPVVGGVVDSALTFQTVSAELKDLAEGTTYHYRVIATNQTGSTVGPDRTFSTFHVAPVISDMCPNDHSRQQTGTALLLDCRAYELVSAVNTGGYDVESDLVPGQSPYGSYSEAEDPPRVLYAVHGGGIPGTNNPTDRAPDPYVATRSPETGWSTEYAGVPANNPFSTAPFSSIPSGVDASLETLAFGGPEDCSPCFEGGYTGIPVHLPDGTLVQGMEGPENPGPAATPDGYIAKDLSADGEHFIFGSTSRFAPGGNNATGDVSIYDHDLKTGETQAVSNAPGGGALSCPQGAGKCNAGNKDSNGISELDISADGSHILLGQKVATDADGNVYWHLYMDVNDSLKTIDLTPGTTSGVLYDGMSADGSQVFFSTVEKLGTDSDASADIYEAQIGNSTATVTQISTGTGAAGNTNACDPASNSNGEHWNSIGSAKNCNALAIGGGGGVAAGSGSIYLLSPEQLDGASNGIENQPNLYLAASGQAPRFVATLDPEDPVVVDSLKAAEERHTTDFQVTPSGEFAAFATDARLNEYENAGFSEIYRYDASAESLDCASCNPTGGVAEGNASLASDGLSLADDGRVFFTTLDALSSRDNDSRADIYEWEPQGAGPEAASCEPSSAAFFDAFDGCLELISSGTSPFDSSLLGVSANGIDAYFFTHDSLTPQVQGGHLVRIYDARELAGFAYVPPEVPCKASDECHGAGTPTPSAPNIESSGGGAGNEVKSQKAECKPGYIKRHGKCVPKHHKPKHHRKGKKK